MINDVKKLNSMEFLTTARNAFLFLITIVYITTPSVEKA